MYELVRGPLVWVSLIVFVLGTIFQVFRFFSLSRKAGLSPHVPLQSPKSKKGCPDWYTLGGLVAFLEKARYTILAVSPVTVTISTIFHLLLIFVPLFLLGHNELIELALGIGLPSISEYASDLFTVVVLICCAFFLYRRLFLSRVRSITTFYDYLVLALATVPFLSGFLAYHQFGDYRTTMIIHMLSGELMLMAIPFTKLTHMIFFFLSRVLIQSEHTFGKGSRSW